MGDYTSDMTDQVARTDPALATVTVPGAGLTGAPPTGPQPRLRDRLARLGTPRAPVNMALEPILQSLREHHPKAEVALPAFDDIRRKQPGAPRFLSELVGQIDLEGGHPNSLIAGRENPPVERSVSPPRRKIG